ncbi:MAG TPA: CHAT domain-containing protein, partial [Myxococcales bacterium]|nr:CHAT domain-containing protein [Myxococcales bacterium]
HSFSDFDLFRDETALYTDSDLFTAQDILTRITGSRPSRLDGQITSDYANADLFFVNPNGVFFGSDFALDTRQSFFAVTADRLELLDPVDGAVTLLNMTTPIEVPPLPGFDADLDEGGVQGLRFLRDDVADITVEGFEVLNFDTLEDSELIFAAGNITFGTEDDPVNIATRGRDLIAIAIGGSGRIFDSSGEPGSNALDLAITDLHGNNINPTGVVSLSGSIDPRGANGDVGEVFFLPGGSKGSSVLEEVSNTVDGLDQLTSRDVFADSLIEEVEASDGSGDLQQAQSKEKKHVKTPGVSLFTSTAQAAPMVPRTCESIASGDRKSKFLAATSKRLPASPENWLIAFDTSGDQLLAAAESGELSPVGAIGSSGTNQEDLERSTRTQRAMASVAGAVRGGRFEDAAAGFELVVSQLEAAMDPQGASEVLLAYAQLQQNDGRFRGARRSLERALALAEPLGDAEYTAGIRTSLGNALIGTGDLVRAEEELTRGLNVVIASKNKQPAPSVLNNLGNRHAATRDFKSALWAYERSAKLAREIGRKGDEARALAGAARAALESGQLTNARVLLDQASPLVASLSEMRERVPLNIHMGRTFALLAAMSPAGRAASLLSAFESYDAALKGAEQLGDLRAVALANLNLGALYRDEQHRSEALYLTRLAQRAAEGINAPELLYRAHWQEGQILWSEHQVGPALAAHRRAVEILEDTKPVASDGYGSTDASFRMAVGGVYQDTVDLLLRTSSMVESERESDLLIAEARETLEKLKGAELRDYFEDECIASVGSTGRGIDNLGESAAVVYTVTLPDRVEMLVGLPDGIERFTTKVSAARLNKSIDDFRVAVQNPLTNAHQTLGKQLHNWIVAPYAERLDEEGIETLVFIADGRLRTLPFAALSDSEDRYVGERFATATALSLRLLTPPEMVSERGRPVLAGLSESVQGFSELAAVPEELAQIKAIEGGDLLLNEAFTLDEIRSAVQREIPGIVHLATHAVFTGNPDTSFLLTHGGKVGFDDLSDVVGMTQADGAPLDLLVLSACETAVGNDRAGLGFTGSAIRSGARSAMGSLWPISDAAAQTLMIDFYKGLNTPELNKAEALQKAQATLRDSERFAHPFYWAPFTLVNDWM